MKKKNEPSRNPARIRQTIALALLAGTLPSFAVSAPWDLGIDAELGVIHTNNVFLGPSDAEENDTVYTISPVFTLETEGERTEAVLRYNPTAYYYSEFSEADEVFHQLDASLQTALIRDRLFINLDGAHFQSIVDPEAPFPTSNLPITGNRVDSTVLGARPSWQQRLGGADLLLEAGYRYLDYDGEDFQSSNERDASFSLNNHAKQEGFAWGIDYSYRRMEYEVSTPFEFQRAALDLGFWASSGLRLFAGGGAETSFDNIFEANLDDDFWEVGFQYEPNARFGMELAVGERSYGTSFRGNLNYTLRRGSLTASYVEAPSTRADTVFAGNRVRIGDQSLDGILDRPGNADRFVSKRGELQLSIDLNKSELSLRVFNESRAERTTELGTPQEDESLSGFSAGWQWQFGSRTNMNVDADIGRRDDGVQENDIIRYSLGVDYQLSARTSLVLSINRTEQDAGADSTSNYTENQGQLLLRVTLL